jgi:hypothetical protein
VRFPPGLFRRSCGPASIMLRCRCHNCFPHESEFPARLHPAYKLCLCCLRLHRKLHCRSECSPRNRSQLGQGLSNSPQIISSCNKNHPQRVVLVMRRLKQHGPLLRLCRHLSLALRLSVKFRVQVCALRVSRLCHLDWDAVLLGIRIVPDACHLPAYL